jgi:hypothetical protein
LIISYKSRGLVFRFYNLSTKLNALENLISYTRLTCLIGCVLGALAGSYVHRSCQSAAARQNP